MDISHDFPYGFMAHVRSSSGISSPRRHIRGHQQRGGRRQVAAHVLCPEAAGARGQGDATGRPGVWIEEALRIWAMGLAIYG
jgi:hypothetical protein